MEQIDSDLSVFHRIRKPHKLSAPRFLKLAQQLHHYDGAFRHSLQLDMNGGSQQAGAAPVPQHRSTTGTEPVKDTPPEVMAKLSESSRFPGIEYDD